MRGAEKITSSFDLSGLNEEILLIRLKSSVGRRQGRPKISDRGKICPSDPPLSPHIPTAVDDSTRGGSIESYEADLSLVHNALQGHAEPVKQLVDRLTPVIHVRVMRVLMRREEAHQRDLRPDIEDLVQDVFEGLFAHEGRILRSWAPSRGLSLENFVGFVAERKVGQRLRTAKRNPWTERPTDRDQLDRTASVGTEQHFESRQSLTAILEELRQWLTPDGRLYFQLLYVDEHSIAEVAERVGVTPSALYAWRNRLRKKTRSIRERQDVEGKNGA